MAWMGNNRRLSGILAVLGFVVAGWFLVMLGCSQGEAAKEHTEPRCDVVVIDGMKAFGTLERPAVMFPHDAHTKVLQEHDKDCTTCHLKKDDGSLVQKFMRLADSTTQQMLELYHTNCLGCHKEILAAGEKAGPVACGDCHRRTPQYRSVREPFGFDKSLHYRHIKASDEKCERCHHVYNDTTKQLVYVKGTESSCRDCHRQQREDNRSSFREAAHAACVNCHWKIAVTQPADSTGPYVCEGCHSKERQQAIAVIAKPPRLKRNQPDFVLLAAAEKERSASKLKTVPFSHIDHEEYLPTCRVCHHESLKRCTECHTLEGSQEGKGVTLQQAMHEMVSDHSCIGCHDTKKFAVGCNGCHDFMEQGRLSEYACLTCHAGPEPERVEKVRKQYTSLKPFRPKSSVARLSFAKKDIPDNVVIKTLAKKYEPAVMPHKKIIDSLRAIIKRSNLATYFHVREDIVCQGCHHHSPVGAKPPLCESCHGKPFNEADLFKPGLYGSFHRQCLGCHQSMKIEKPSDCVGCHAKKKTEAEL